MARTKAQNVATPVESADAPEVPEVLKGVVTDSPTPPGDAKQQTRRTALEAKKAEIAARAAANGTTSKSDAPREAPRDEPKAEEPAPAAPQPKLTTADKLRELLAVSEGRRDHAKVASELRTGIQAILDDLATAPKATQPKATQPKADKGKANTELENAILKAIQDVGAPVTIQKVHELIGAEPRDAKPRAAMYRMVEKGVLTKDDSAHQKLYAVA